MTNNNQYDYIDIGSLFDDLDTTVKENKKEEERQEFLKASQEPNISEQKLKEFVIPTDWILQYPTLPNRKTKQAVLIDANSFAYKFYFGSPEKIHQTLNQNINMIELMLKKIFAHLVAKPDYLFVVWEWGKGIRNEILPSYKAHRPEKQENFKWQTKTLHKILQEIGIPSVFVPTWEADDVIYSLAKDLVEKHEDINVYVHTKDKDFFQLCDENIMICRDRDDVYDKIKFENTFGFPVEKFVNYLAMMGDQADNIPSLAPRMLWETTVKKLFAQGIYTPQQILEQSKRLKEEKIIRGIDKLVDALQNPQTQKNWELNLSLVKMYKVPETKAMIEKELFNLETMQTKFTYDKVSQSIVQAFQLDEILPIIQWVFKA